MFFAQIVIRSPVLSGFVDIRDRMSAPLLRTKILTLDDLKCGVSLKGRVVNIASFGAFIDIGVGTDGLLHRQHLVGMIESLMVGETLDVAVVSVDLQRGRPRISLKLSDRPD